jgi:alanine racemase
MLFVC